MVKLLIGLGMGLIKIPPFLLKTHLREERIMCEIVWGQIIDKNGNNNVLNPGVVIYPVRK